MTVMYTSNRKYDDARFDSRQTSQGRDETLYTDVKRFLIFLARFLE